MNSLAFIGTILTIHILAWLTPGPLFVLILRNSLVHSRKIGMWTAVGITLGNAVHILYSVTGLALLLSASTAASSTIKFLGAGYLLYLGIKTMIPKSENTSRKQVSPMSPFQAVKTGFLTNLLSPKASLFFASIFGTVLSSGVPRWAIIFLMLAMPLNSLVMASLWSFVFTQEKVRQRYLEHQPIVNTTLGLLLIVFAVMVAFS